MLSKIAKYFGIMRTEDFHRDFQLAKEALERLSSQDDELSPLRFRAKWAKTYLGCFEKRISEVKVFPSNLELCYVPWKFGKCIRGIRRMDWNHAEYYWPSSVREQVPEYN